MSLIITATDFSEIADNAVFYACGLAKDAGSSVVIFNSYIIPVTFSETPMPVIPMDDLQNIAEQRMAALVSKLREAFPGLEIQSHIIYGEIIDVIEEYLSTSAKPWLIAIGNSGDTFFIGSNLLTALRELVYPVIAIPENAKYTAVKKICLAVDNKTGSDQLPVSQIMALVQYTGASLYVVNISNKENEPAISFSKELEMALAPLQPTYQSIGNANTDEAIQEYITINTMDWLAVMPHKHSFFTNLFKKSHTEAMVKMAHIPLVALHETQA